MPRTESKESFTGHKKTNFCPITDRDFTIMLLQDCELGTFVFLDPPADVKKDSDIPFQFRAVVKIQSIYFGMVTQPQTFWVQKHQDKYIIVWGKTARIDHFMPETIESISLDKHDPFNRFNSPDEIVEHLLKHLKPFPKPDVLAKLASEMPSEPRTVAQPPQLLTVTSLDGVRPYQIARSDEGLAKKHSKQDDRASASAMVSGQVLGATFTSIPVTVSGSADPHPASLPPHEIVGMDPLQRHPATLTSN